MQTVSTLLDELVRRANEVLPGATGTKALRERISAAAGLTETLSQPAIPMWKQRGIPWPMHDAVEAVCVDLGVPADRKLFRVVEAENAA